MEANPDTQPLYELLNAFSVFGSTHDQIQHTKVGPIAEVDVDKLNATQFPALFVVPGNMTIDVGSVTFSVEVIVATEQPVDMESRAKVLSNMAYIMRDVIALGHQHQYETNSPLPFRSVLQLPVNCESFTARFDNMLIGWACELAFELDNTNNLCLVPD